MNYNEQKSLKKKSKMCKAFRFTKPYTIKEDGLFGREHEVLIEMFSEDRKTVVKFSKLSSLQKKVIRKMNFDKRAFLSLS